MTTLQEAAQRALHDAATSLETIGRLAGKTHYVGDDGERIETFMGHHDQVRGYAQSRAGAAREALAALASEPQAEHLEGFDQLCRIHKIAGTPMERLCELFFQRGMDLAGRAEQPGAVGLSEQAILHALDMARTDAHKQGDRALFLAFGRRMWAQFEAQALATTQTAAPFLNGNQTFWVENRTKILDAIGSAGYMLMSNQDGFWLMKKGSPAATQGAKT